MRIFLLSFVVLCVVGFGRVAASDSSDDAMLDQLDSSEESSMEMFDICIWDYVQDGVKLFKLPPELLEKIATFLVRINDYARLLKTCHYFSRLLSVNNLSTDALYSVLRKRYDLEQLHAMLSINFTMIHRQLYPERREVMLAFVINRLKGIQNVTGRFERAALSAMSMHELLIAMFTLYIPGDTPINSAIFQSDDNNIMTVYASLTPRLQAKMNKLLSILFAGSNVQGYMQLLGYLHSNRRMVEDDDQQ